MAVPDAPDEVWSVRQVPPPGQSFPDKRNKLWQPLVYVRHERKADGLWVWKMDRPLVGTTYKNPDTAERAGKKAAGRIPFCTYVQNYDLAIRLADLVPDHATRSRIRLGQAWQFVLVTQQKSTSRGTKYLAALCEHDRPAKPVDDELISYFNRTDKITLEHRIGRFNERQVEQLRFFCEEWGITYMAARSLPVKPGNRLAPKHYR